MFAVIFSLYVLIVMEFVPVWNNQEELDHYTHLGYDIVDMKAAVDNAFTTGAKQSANLHMGLIYSNKYIFPNRRNFAQGSFNVKRDKWIRISYNEILSTGEVLPVVIKTFNTSTVTYTFNSVQALHPIILEHGIIRESGNNYTSLGQDMIRGNNILINSLNISTEQKSFATMDEITLHIYPVSVPKGTILGSNISIGFITDYPYWWKDELNKISGIAAVTDGQIVTVFFSNNMVIKMGETLISDLSQEIQTPSSSRLFKVSADDISVPIENNLQLIIEAQDAFNNPVADLDVVCFVSAGSGSVNPAALTTGSDGRTVTTFTAGSVEDEINTVLVIANGVSNEVFTFRTQNLPAGNVTFSNVSEEGGIFGGGGVGEWSPDSPDAVVDVAGGTWMDTPLNCSNITIRNVKIFDVQGYNPQDTQLMIINEEAGKGYLIELGFGEDKNDPVTYRNLISLRLADNMLSLSSSNPPPTALSDYVDLFDLPDEYFGSANEYDDYRSDMDSLRGNLGANTSIYTRTLDWPTLQMDMKVDACNIINYDMADYLTINTAGAIVTTGGDDEIHGLTITNTNSSLPLQIDRIIVSWTTDNGELVEELKIDGSDFWDENGCGGDCWPSERQASGTELDGDYTLAAGATDVDLNNIEFDSDMSGKTIVLTFIMKDTTLRSFALTPPDG